MPIPWAAIAQAVQLGMQAGKMVMDYKKSKKNGDDSPSYDDGSDDAFGGRVFQAYAQKDGPAPEGGEDSWMQRIPEIAKVMTSFRGNASPSQYAPPLPDIAPVAPGAGISANPMSIPMVPRMPFEARAAAPSYSGGEPEYLRLRDILTRYRLR